MFWNAEKSWVWDEKTFENISLDICKVYYFLYNKAIYTICNTGSKNVVKISRIHIIFILMFWNIRSNLFRVYSCCFIFFMVDDLLDKLETRNEKWEMIFCQYNLLFLIFKLFVCQQYNNGFTY